MYPVFSGYIEIYGATLQFKTDIQEEGLLKCTEQHISFVVEVRSWPIWRVRDLLSRNLVGISQAKRKLVNKMRQIAKQRAERLVRKSSHMKTRSVGL